nr:TcpQ domain-containing protein [Achromobacter ruhlandii]
MQTPSVVAVLLVAGLLSACGFAPPAPPMPPDTKRVAINHGDPRKAHGQQQARTSKPEPVPIALTLQPSTSPQATAEEQPAASSGVTAADSGTNGAAPPIPVPLAPTPSPSPAAGVPLAGEVAPSALPSPAIALQPQPSIIAANTVPTTPAQADLPTAAVARQKPDGAIDPQPQVDSQPEAIPVVIKEIWRISPDDGTVRQALARWAAKANWTFGPDQWELNFDLPIQAPAEFEAESFQDATQALSQAIAMTESPIRPCFYGNRVLRMVPFTRSCNRSPATQS